MSVYIRTKSATDDALRLLRMVAGVTVVRGRALARASGSLPMAMRGGKPDVDADAGGEPVLDLSTVIHTENDVPITDENADPILD